MTTPSAEEREGLRADAEAWGPNPEGFSENRLAAGVLRLLTALDEAEERAESAWWNGYAEGREEAETADLSYDELTAERDALRAQVADLTSRLAGGGER